MSSPSPGARLLVVDDDAAVRDSLRRSLAFEGYDVLLAADGDEAVDTIGRARPHAVVLDLQMPRVDGIEVCRRLRAAGDDTPVLMLTARDGVEDRVTGLDVGADDYLSKPFSTAELLARLRALLRRARQGAAGAAGDAAHEDVLAYDDVIVDLATREVTRAGVDLALTRTEFDLLVAFLRQPGRVLTRATLLRDVWGYDFDPGSNTLAMYVSYLRRKLDAAGEARLLHTVRGVGFMLRAETGR